MRKEQRRDQTAVGTISVHMNIQNRSVNNCFIIIARGNEKNMRRTSQYEINTIATIGAGRLVKPASLEETVYVLL